jgi:hypothetical protein
VDLLQALRLDALAGVLIEPKGELTEEDRQRFLRRIFRWYSREFATPLHIVESLPVIDVLRHYYEAKVDAMDEDALEAERKLLIETDDERRARIRALEAEDIADDDWAQQVEKEIAAEAAAKKAASPKRANLPTPKDRDSSLGEAAGERPSPTLGGSERSREASLPAPVAPAGFKMEFANDDDFNRELEGLGALDQPAKKR